MLSYQEFLLGTRLVFGPGCVERMEEEIRKQGYENILLVTDQGIVRSGVLEHVTGVLDAANIRYSVFHEVQSNPDVAHIDKAYHSIREQQTDLIIAVGGGSVMDAAKAFALLLTNHGSIRDYEGRGVFQKEAIPLLAVPTTVGTGSEVTRACVISDHERHLKMIVGGPSLAPKIAFLDACLLMKLPSHLVAATGIDALTHAIEGYVCKKANPITDALNRQALTMIHGAIRPAVADSGNLEAINNMLMASTIAGIGAGNASLGIVHAISHAIGGYYDVPHGLVNGILLPHAIEWNWIANPVKYANVFELLGGGCRHAWSLEEKAKEASSVVRSLLEDLQMPQRLTELGLKSSNIDMIARQAIEDGYVPNNPRRLTEADVRKLIAAAW
ncbi:iron-containing alcohol dehydrogenase [Brevibacillus panacihumi]|uniref:iron-containing alcohol dehydrogenase n=1 Tax=Brevibacillus panacihumi TaxID=497735 RepID=UPI003CFF40C5